MRLFWVIKLSLSMLINGCERHTYVGEFFPKHNNSSKLIARRQNNNYYLLALGEHTMVTSSNNMMHVADQRPSSFIERIPYNSSFHRCFFLVCIQKRKKRMQINSACDGSAYCCPERRVWGEST